MALKAPATDAAAAAELPEDVLLDIFARVAPDPLDLLRCAATCHRWFRLISGPAVLRRAGAGHLPENARRASFLIGAFYQVANHISPCQPQKRFRPDLPPQFARLYDAPRTAGGSAAGLTLASFLPNTDGLFDYAEPLTSRRGLLLLRIMPRPIDLGKLHLAVCHPLIGEPATRLLPPPPLDLKPERFGSDVTGYALLTSSADHDQERPRKKPAFRVILTVVHSDDQLAYVHSYSAATGSWSPPIRCPQTYGLTRCGQRDGVVVRGTVHWLYKDNKGCLCTLDVSADTAQVSLTKIPIKFQIDHRGIMVRPPSLFACVAGGKLSIAIDGTLELWTKEEQDDNVQQRGVDLVGCWRPKLMVRKPAKILAFAEAKGAMLVRCASGLFTLDLQSMEMEPVNGEDTDQWEFVRFCSSFSWQRKHGSCSDLTHNSRVLYEIDWPSYLHHLSTLSI